MLTTATASAPISSAAKTNNGNRRGLGGPAAAADRCQLGAGARAWAVAAGRGVRVVAGRDARAGAGRRRRAGGVAGAAARLMRPPGFAPRLEAWRSGLAGSAPSRPPTAGSA